MCKTGINRFEYIDVCRGIGIIVVIFGHSSIPFILNKLICGFHMPLFFMLSGYLFSTNSKPIKGVLEKYFGRYIIPYFILCGINLTIQSIRLVGMGERNYFSLIIRYIGGILYSRGTVFWMPNCSPLWYLTCIFCTVIIYNLLQKYMIVPGIGVLGFVILGGIISSSGISKLPWNVDTAMLGLGFMYIGHIIKSKNLLIAISMKNTIVQFSMAIIGSGISIVSILLNNVNAVSFDNNEYGNLLLMFFGGGAFWIMLLSYQFCRKVKAENILKKFLVFYGRNTILIMGFDYLSGDIARLILDKYNSWEIFFLKKNVILFSFLSIYKLFIELIKHKQKEIKKY